MEILWERGSALVRDVHSELYRRKGLAYTTVMTEMTQMYKKGILAYNKRGRAYVYTPRLSKREALEDTLEEFIDDFFHSSREELVNFLVGASQASQKEPVTTARPKAHPAADSPTDLEPASQPDSTTEEDITLL